MSENKEACQIAGSVFALTERERDVLRLVSEGWTNKAVARELDLCESTIKAHMGRIMRVLGCTNRTQAALLGFCIDRKLHDHAAQLITRMIDKPGHRAY